MDIQTIIQDYLKQPLPVWENEITQLLVEHKWEELALQSNITPNTYTIAECVIKDKSVTETNLPLSDSNYDIKIAVPSDDLKGFYKKHGIKPIEISIDKPENEFNKIITALQVFQKIEPIQCFILKIVKSAQLIKAEYSDTDISYSHPEIPFSIFFSVCEEISIISDLRVAESILHEAMHLKLTLIENIVPLIIPNARGVYFSPWRDEPRPARGVLHGLFVFKALLDFFEDLIKTNISEKKYIQLRINQIKKDLFQLKDFVKCGDLTIDGAILITNLLPSN
ncbi:MULTISPECIES: HEXXH motif-containing putative peptide modification protein [unclassified Flavobacterium]|uniref:aKG-HExxH-type peptide beta-hydroxylase n=1 Tax=unclassified Flavobacterium TaxID=196869 RepID=UPI0006ABB74F|nr:MULTISPECIES: HEXXH motif-containing putative peptide modification protein [unclassified Flavobacterium]KOP38919.1 hypothetical protein AKO67_07840 [Flavobacterium sp. VMW]OWU92871.1 hypothetical protein APR43_02100 [Flavobacterium sp. NLM]